MFFPLFQVRFGPKVGAFVIWYHSHPYRLSSSLLTSIQLCGHRSGYLAVFLICLYIFIFHIGIIKVSYIFNTKPLSIWFSRCWKLNLLNKDSSSNFFLTNFLFAEPAESSQVVKVEKITSSSAESGKRWMGRGEVRLKFRLLKATAKWTNPFFNLTIFWINVLFYLLAVMIIQILHVMFMYFFQYSICDNKWF